MIEAREHEHRCTRLADKVQALGLDAILAVGIFPEKEGHVAYLTGHRLWTPQWPTSERSRNAGYSFALVSASEVALFAMGAKPAPQNTHLTHLEGGSDPVTALSRFIKAHRYEKIGVAGMDIMPASLFAALQDMGLALKNAEKVLFNARLIKSNAEQAILEEGAHIAIAAINYGQSKSLSGITARQIAGTITGQALALGAEHVLRCRVRTGGQTAIVNWPYASAQNVRDGDAIQVDLVGLHKGYLFDISRVWAIRGARAETRDAIEAAWKATHGLANAIKPGKKLGEAVAQWRSSLKDGNEGGLQLDGHSIGLDVVEAPWITEASEIRVSEGMVFCIEPSIRINQKEEFKIEETLRISGEHAVIFGQ